jgi:hypothetical protein
MVLQEAYSWYLKYNQSQLRSYQLNKVIEEIEDDFHFEKIICIETGASHNWDDGCVGLFFAKVCELTNGEFHSVDINPELVNNSKLLYNSLGFTNINHHINDSVNYLHNTEVIPNLVHLDSWDLDLTNPFPSALHGWREFIAIEGKMSIGSILIVDDNFFKGTWVSWDYSDGSESKIINITYPIVGKGSNIWHFINSGRSNWKKLSKDTAGSNQKLIFKKVKL